MNKTNKEHPPLFQTSVACGFPSPADDYLDKRLSLDELLILSPSSTFFVRASGESMMPLINEGDLLVIDRSMEVRRGDVVLAVLDGEFTVKRFFDRELRPENAKFNSIYLTEERDFFIWGVVSSIIHQLKSST